MGPSNSPPPPLPPPPPPPPPPLPEPPFPPPPCAEIALIRSRTSPSVPLCVLELSAMAAGTFLPTWSPRSSSALASFSVTPSTAVSRTAVRGSLPLARP
ncbi:hypothetical protein CP974_18730 [Streptomyces fradiae ATCC 10745 = DSM 40063]|nr:hypothetical protein CP974_18730 [Streptomyces fradiae ATCC 10745 = DSM 40063]